MIDLMLISNKPDIITSALEAGVSRIFIDLEVNGKVERQGHLDTHITDHKLSDIKIARNLIDKVITLNSKAKLLVRINPFYEGTNNEIESVISSGADYIMLPMISNANEVLAVAKIISRRAAFIPLIETADSFLNLDEIITIPGVDEIYIGLNDLHLDFSLSFMFEPLSNGMLNTAKALLNSRGVPFGFGGIARIGEGVLPGELVLGEHLRLGSSSVILSRTFMSSCPANIDIKEFLDFEIKRLRCYEKELLNRAEEMIQVDHQRVCKIIHEIVRVKNEKSI